VPSKNLFDQFLAEPPGQWARAQQQAVIDRAKDRVVQQFRLCLRPQLACILAALQIGDPRIPPGTNPSVEELLKNGWLARTCPGTDPAGYVVNESYRPSTLKSIIFGSI
jgi:hypothetical protein